MKMFFAYCDKNQFYDRNIKLDVTSVLFLPKTIKEKRLQKVEILFKK